MKKIIVILALVISVLSADTYCWTEGDTTYCMLDDGSTIVLIHGK